MTDITQYELKIVFFGICFISAVGVFWALYSQAPIQDVKVNYETGTTAMNGSTSTTSSSWISNLITLPSGFKDLTIVTTIFLAPVIIFLAPIAVRYIKDLVTQWI